MQTQGKHFLWFILALFVIVSGLVAWSELFQTREFFLAGARPIGSEQPAAPEPQLPPLRDTDPSIGGKAADVLTIVEFADYTCLYCRLTQLELQKSVPEFGDKIRFVWRDLPIASEHPESMLSAMAGRCANDQGKFWELHDEMFVASRLDLESLKQLAQKLHMNVNAFESCLSSGRYLQPIQMDIAIAEQHAIMSAPTLFIGDIVLNGYASEAEIRAAIRSGLRKQP